MNANTPRPQARPRRAPQREVDLQPEKTPMAPDGVKTVKVTAYGREEVDLSDSLMVPVIENPARVRVSGSVTRNMGDYNSVKVEVSVELPCQPHETDIENCYQYTAELVDKFVSQELEVATKE